METLAAVPPGLSEADIAVLALPKVWTAVYDLRCLGDEGGVLLQHKRKQFGLWLRQRHIRTPIERPELARMAFLLGQIRPDEAMRFAHIVGPF